MSAGAVLDRASPVPLYRQIETILRQEMLELQDVAQRGRLTENDLIARFGVSRATVRQALGRLAAAGLVHRHPRRGTYPSSRWPFEQPLSGMYSFVQSLQDAGLPYSASVVSLRMVRSANGLSDHFGGDVELVRVQRLHRLAGEPLIAETIWLRSQAVPGIKRLDLNGSVYELLRDRYGLSVTSATESIRPVVLDRRQSTLLEVAKGGPAFFVERLSHTAEGPVEVRHSLIRGDRYLYSVQLHPDGREP